MRFMASGARIGTAFSNVGLSGDFGGSYFLTKLVGTGKARELYYLAERLDAATCLSLGIANRVFPDDRLHAETMAVAKRLASGPRVTLRYLKRNMNAAERERQSVGEGKSVAVRVDTGGGRSLKKKKHQTV